MLFQFRLVSTLCNMAKNKGQRCITSLFQTNSSEEKMQFVERELARMRESNKEATSCNVQKENYPLGKPRMQHSGRILSEHQIKKQDDESKRPSKLKKK